MTRPRCWLRNRPAPSKRGSVFAAQNDGDPTRSHEAAIEMLDVADARQRGRLMDDRAELGGGNHLAYCPGVERVEHDRLASQPAQPSCLIG
jgi:hypothetical protein